MTVARTVADVLDDHTVFEIECIDRMYLNAIFFIQGSWLRISLPPYHDKAAY
jgi:hypothetical protein